MSNLARTAAQKPQPVIDSALKHFSYRCPGLHGPGCRQHIELKEFTTLFTDPRAQVVIPLFQRKYCWTDRHARDLFRDVIKAGTSFNNYHSVGKIILKRQADGGVKAEGNDLYEHVQTIAPTFVCIDGQQRITTMSLLVASIRDALLGVLRTTQANAADFQTVRSAAKKEVNVLTDHLFLPDQLKNLRPFLDKAGQRQSDSQHPAGWAELLPQGAALPGTRLVPSFLDRKSFNEAIVIGLIRYQAAKAGAADTNEAQPSEGTVATRQWQNKMIFDQLVHEYLQLNGTVGQGTISAASGEKFIRRVAALREHCLRGIRIMYCEILNDINFSQVFLWFQEKAVCGMGSLLYNPNPGVKFRAMDLVRNCLLAPIMNQPREQQEAHHHEFWLNPIETPVTAVDGPSGFDLFLVHFLDAEEARFFDEGVLSCVKSSNGGLPQVPAFGEVRRGACAQIPAGKVEQTVRAAHKVLRQNARDTSRGGGTTIRGIDLYARFQSYYEFCLRHGNRGNNKMPEDELVLRILKQLQQFVPQYMRTKSPDHGRPEQM